MADMYVDKLEGMKEKSIELENINRLENAADMYADRADDPAAMKVLRNIATKKKMSLPKGAFDNMASLKRVLGDERDAVTKMLEGKAGKAMIIDSSKKEDEE